MRLSLQLHAAKMRIRKLTARSIPIGPMSRIQRAVQDRFGYDFMVKTNTPAIVMPRQIAMYLTKRLLPWASLQMIGMHYAMHHTTILASIRKIEEERNEDENLDKLLVELESELAWGSVSEPKTGKGAARRELIAEIMSRKKAEVA